MKKYAKLTDVEKGLCQVGIGTDEEFYKSIGFELMDVEQDAKGNWYLADKVPTLVYGVSDYDRLLEDHIKTARVARGYTLREPSDFKDSAVPRWKQDAADFIAFRDACLLYGQSVMNEYAATGKAPSLEVFKAGLPQIVWTYKETEGV